MGLGQTLVLGAIAGVTIMVGMPLGRLRRPAPTVRLLLNAFAVGVLLFLFWDVLDAAFGPVHGALTSWNEGAGGLGPVFGYGLLFCGGLILGLMSLVYYEQWMGRAQKVRSSLGPGTMSTAELPARLPGLAWVTSPARRVALLIAVGIGLHNFAEGLAIGGSAARGEVGLATLLVVGFALHNATEGFGVTAPLAADRGQGEELPSWTSLFGLGLVAGGPTFLGTLVGHQFSSDVLAIVFLTLAAGSILYVIIQLLGIAAKANRRDLLAWGLLAGLLAGFVTDFVVTAGGA